MKTKREAELAALRELKADLADLPRPEAPGRRLTDAVMASLPPVAAPRPWWGFLSVSLQLPAWSVALLLVGFVGALFAVSRPGPRSASLPDGVASSGRGDRARALASIDPGAKTSAPMAIPASFPAPARAMASHDAMAHGPAACVPVPVRVPVRFVFHAAKAKRVAVVGDFNHWKRQGTILADDNGDGLWSVTVYLPPGRYQYKFVVDGKWVVDPDASGYLGDGFGGRNAVL
ncbi:MAG: hypothetical protein KAI47_03865, partial [Deltaproteobacteria bacterium]|nr:hypothetical protein [Deltaproteobacteria bacterium]